MRSRTVNSILFPSFQLQSLFLIKDGIDPIYFPHDCSNRNLNNDVFASFSTSCFALAILAPSGFYYTPSCELVETGFSPHGLDPNVSSSASIASICGARFDVFLTEKGNAAVATGAGTYGYSGFVGEDGARVVSWEWIEMGTMFGGPLEGLDRCASVSSIEVGGLEDGASSECIRDEERVEKGR